MSTPNPTHIIAEALSFGGIENHLPAAEHVVSKLTDAGYIIMHHRATCSESGDNCKHLPGCVVAVCICGDDWPCPIFAAAAEGEKP